MERSYDPEPFDIADYKQRVYDRTHDYELRLDAARVDNEIERLRGENATLRQTIKKMLLEGDSEINRLRAALKEIARYEPGSVHIGEYAVALKQYARQVLENQL